jgi:hypothetical protein
VLFVKPYAYDDAKLSQTQSLTLSQTLKLTQTDTGSA